MLEKKRGNWLFLAILLCLTVFLFYGMALVPFHPDESTHIYMSRDLELIFNQPLSIAWTPDLPLNNELILRSLGAPLTKYLIGFGRWITITPQLSSDWIWGLSWEENAAGGALPNRRLLLSSRVITTALLPIALFFLYKAIQNTYSNKTALIAVILLGLNPLFLLHGRRAMNEAAALAGICFFLWAISQEEIRPWLVGLAMAAAFNAKQSAIALLPIGIIAVCKPFKIRSNPNSIAKRIVGFGLFFTVITFMLNPFFWKHPLRAVLASREITAELQAKQLNDYYPRQEDAKKQTISYQTLALLSNLYLSQPSTADVGNYLVETKSQEEQYFKIPLHNIGRNLFPAAVFLILSLSGFMIGVLRLKSSGNITAMPSVLFLLATIFQFFTILYFLPLPWQRYVVPLLPFTCLWTAVGLSPIFENLKLNQSSNVKL